MGNRQDPIEVRWRNIRIRETSQPWDSKESIDRKGEEVPFVASTLRKIQGGYKFVEGPAVGPEGHIYFNDIPNNTTHVYNPKTDTVEIFRTETGGANGLFWTPNDYLISCEGRNRRVSILKKRKSLYFGK